MAREVTDQTTNAAESLVKATVIVLDRVNVQAYLDRASRETSKMLGGNSIVMLS
jgi:hypothetical protein